MIDSPENKLTDEGIATLTFKEISYGGYNPSHNDKFKLHIYQMDEKCFKNAGDGFKIDYLTSIAFGQGEDVKFTSQYSYMFVLSPAKTESNMIGPHFGSIVLPFYVILFFN